MRFGPVPVADAEGAILAHATQAGARRLRKAHVLGREDCEALAAAGVGEVTVARLDPGDLAEDEAARRVAAALVVSGIEARPPGTGRVNLHARAAGLFTVDAALVDAVNAVDPAITVATLPANAAVEAGQMVATVKIIPFAVAGGAVARAAALAGSREAFAIHPFRALDVAVVQTVLPGIKPAVLDKTLRITADRLARSGSRIVAERRVPHDAAAVAEAVAALSREADLVVVFGASALCDFDDVIPAAIRAAGGTVLRAGMPVDPGNLLVLGRIGTRPVLGAPGCARSPKENGFDWVLDRLLAGVEVTAGDIGRMGVGGLLMEIASRPQPREAPRPEAAAKVAAVVLAAGRSSRMGGTNKLLARFDGEPLIRRTVARACRSRAAAVVVVTGFERARVEEAVQGLDVTLVHNAGHAAGLSGSLKAGVAALPADAAGALVVLGDMPAVTTADLDSLIAAFETARGGAIVRAAYGGRRGNPVILPRDRFADIMALEGDSGARAIVDGGAGEVVDVELGAAAVLDVDTPEALASAGGTPDG